MTTVPTMTTTMHRHGAVRMSVLTTLTAAAVATTTMASVAPAVVLPTSVRSLGGQGLGRGGAAG